MITQEQNELKKIQDWMQNALIFPRLVDEKRAANNLLETPNLTALDALGIYQRSYYARLLSCMREQFPALCYALGDSIFNQFSIEYLREMPSDSYTLYELGRRFRDYLSDTRPDQKLAPSEQELWIDFMVELAGFERLAFTLFDAPGNEGELLGNSDMNTDKELVLQQCFGVYAAQFPVARFYCLVRDVKEPKLPPLQKSYIALVRVDYSLQLLVLNYSQYCFLDNLIRTKDVESSLVMTSMQLVNDVSTNQLESSVDIEQCWLTQNGWRDQWLRSGFFIKKR